MQKHFNAALTRTMIHEGNGTLSNHRYDPGQQTYSGISRVYWPELQLWKIIDQCILSGVSLPNLDDQVEDFYRVHFWNRIQGDKLAAVWPKVAYEVFDTAVNMDVPRAVTFLQTGYNIARGEYGVGIEEDGKLGPITMEALKNYISSKPGTPELNAEILLNCMNGEQYIFYKNNPRRKYFRGWFRRV